jgi:selenium-binding protein 1
MKAEREKVLYTVALYVGTGVEEPDYLATVDVDPDSPTYSQVIERTPMPNVGDELHHFGWNACSSALCHTGHHSPERRYLLVPGLRSSRLHVFDTQPDPAAPRLTKVIEAEELAAKAGYSRPHTLHCGPDGLYMSCLGGANGSEGPGGVALLDHDSFEIGGQFETERGPQYLAYDLWWHLSQNTMITSEWGTPSMIEDGIVPEQLLGRKYGHAVHFWDLGTGRHLQRVDLGDEHQMALELRPAHDPRRDYGFVGVVVSVEDLSASVWLWHRDGDRWAVTKVITIPAEPADAADLPELLRGFGAVPPLVTDINLSVDDKWLYVSCWGTGDLHRYDVSDPFHPRHTASVRLGGIVSRKAHPAEPGTPLAGGSQMVEVSRDGRRVYLTNSLYGAWDDQFYPDGVGAWMAKLDAGADGSMTPDERFFPHGDDFRGLRAHQVRLAGGDASSDSYCFA